ncbi:MAG: hypothetical protein IT384_27650 [Deltaproteobacteria bacterium]|nr:hypothetical protein [Deltaproteobacteria bacterium]
MARAPRVSVLSAALPAVLAAILALAAVLVLAAVLALAPTRASAHRPLVTRLLSLEPGEDGQLHCLVQLTLPPLLKRSHLTLVDRNVNGRLEPAERAALTQILAERAIDGVQVWAGTSSIALGRGRAELDVGATANDAAQLMLYAAAPLPAAQNRVEVRTGRISDALELVVLPGARPVMASSRGRIARGEARASLRADDRVTIDVRPSHTSDPK